MNKSFIFAVSKRNSSYKGTFIDFSDLTITDPDLHNLTRRAKTLLQERIDDLHGPFKEVPEPTILTKHLVKECNERPGFYTLFKITCETIKMLFGFIGVTHRYGGHGGIKTEWELRVPDHVHMAYDSKAGYFKSIFGPSRWDLIKDRLRRLPKYDFININVDRVTYSYLDLPQDTPQRLCEEICHKLNKPQYDKYDFEELQLLFEASNEFGRIYNYNNRAWMSIFNKLIDNRVTYEVIRKAERDFWGKIYSEERYKKWESDDIIQHYK